MLVNILYFKLAVFCSQ